MQPKTVPAETMSAVAKGSDVVSIKLSIADVAGGGIDLAAALVVELIVENGV